MSHITEEEYQKIRAWSLNEGGEPLTTKLTCDDCPARFECEFAGDLYNTDGDCLAEK